MSNSFGPPAKPGVYHFNYVNWSKENAYSILKNPKLNELAEIQKGEFFRIEPYGQHITFPIPKTIRFKEFLSFSREKNFIETRLYSYGWGDETKNAKKSPEEWVKKLYSKGLKTKWGTPESDKFLKYLWVILRIKGPLPIVDINGLGIGIDGENEVLIGPGDFKVTGYDIYKGGIPLITIKKLETNKVF